MFHRPARSAGTTRFTRPTRSASTAEMASPVSSISTAFLVSRREQGHGRGRTEQADLTPGVANVASSAATTRSQVAANWHPAAVAIPCTCGDHGCGKCRIASITSVHSANSVRRLAMVGRGDFAQVVARAEDRARGGRITHSRCVSLPIARKCSRNCDKSGRLSALRRAGLASVSSATESMRSQWTSGSSDVADRGPVEAGPEFGAGW